MKQIVLFFFILTFSAAAADAQSWQWGVRGGSASDSWSSSSSNENVADMATDRNGNVYFASNFTTGSNPSLGHSTIATYDLPGYNTENIIVASYSCSGSLRWKKLIGGSGDCAVKALRVDTFGHVYVMGGVPPNGAACHFDADTVLPSGNHKYYFIVQYDTLGNYKWLRMPGADTASYMTSNLLDMELDGAGNPNIVSFFPPGQLSGSNIAIATAGAYILKYNPQGVLLSATAPPGFNLPATVNSAYYNGTPYSKADFYSFRLAHSPNGNWIVTGFYNKFGGSPSDFMINGQPMDQWFFMAAFNSQWQHLWHIIPDSLFTEFDGRPATDLSNNIYLTGGVIKDQILFGDTIHTNGSGSVPFVAKLNSNGVKQWLSNASDNDALSGNCHAGVSGQAITLTPGGEVAIASGCGGLKWGTYQINGGCNTGLAAFVAGLTVQPVALPGLIPLRKPIPATATLAILLPPARTAASSSAA